MHKQSHKKSGFEKPLKKFKRRDASCIAKLLNNHSKMKKKDNDTDITYVTYLFFKVCVTEIRLKNERKITTIYDKNARIKV